MIRRKAEPLTSVLIRRALIAMSLVSVFMPAAHAQLGPNCAVSVLNRTAQVAADGSWILPDVPANLGHVRARATCIAGDNTITGQSDYFDVPANGVVQYVTNHFDAPQPIVAKLTFTAPRTTFPNTGAGSQPKVRQVVLDWIANAGERDELLLRYRGKKPEEIPDEIKLKTIDCLLKDEQYTNEYFRVTGEGVGEEYGETYIELALFVAKLKDPRSIEALAGAIDVANSIATKLAEFGDPAVDPVIRRIKNPHLRPDVAYALGKFVQGSQIGKNTLSAATIQRIRVVLIGLLRDPSAPTRENALDALVYFKPDDGLLRMVRGIAEKDPETRMGDAGKFYPVRRTAAKLLKEWHTQ